MTEEELGALWLPNFELSYDGKRFKNPLSAPRPMMRVYMPIIRNVVWEEFCKKLDDPLFYIGEALNHIHKEEIQDKVSFVTGWFLSLRELEKRLAEDKSTGGSLANTRIAHVGNNPYDSEKLASLRVVDSYFTFIERNTE